MPEDSKQQKKENTGLKTFPVPFSLGEIKGNIVNNPSKASKEQIIKKALDFHSQGNVSEAAEYYQYFINQGFQDFRVFSNYGLLLRDLGKLPEAELLTRKAIEIKPDYAFTHYNMGNIMLDLDKLQEAELSTRKAIELEPDFALAYNNLGIILRDLGKLKKAELSTRKAIDLEPGIALSHNNLGTILRDLGKLKEAELSTRKAIDLKPDFADAYFNLSLIELLKGDYESGLKHYEFRAKRKKYITIHSNPNIQKVEDRKLKSKEKILVVSEQAPGDVIFHMRYLLPLKKQGVDVSFCAPKKLHSLIKDSGIHPNPLSPEECTLVTEGEWIPLLSLLKYFKVSPNNPVINTPYLSTTETLKDKWRKILSNEKRPIIGINWQGSKKLDETFYKGRSIPLEKFSKLLEKNDIRFLSFQKGFGSEQMEECTFKDHFVSCQKQIDEIWDYSETAAIIEGCDLIITNDCSIGPLSAGMGKKVWLMLKKIPFWTWGLEGESTFWYPSMRLFRQKELDNWDEVMERVSIELQKQN